MQLIEFCKSKQITLVVVNMPVSEDMEKLAPGNAYKDFSKTLKSGSDAKQYLLIDLGQDKDFTDNLYIDGLHLNAVGAHMVAVKLAEHIKQDYPEIVETIARQAAQQKGAQAGESHN